MYILLLFFNFYFLCFCVLEGLGIYLGVEARQAEFEFCLAYSARLDGCTVTIQSHFVCSTLFYGCF